MNELSRKIMDFFNEGKIEKLARKNGFVKRQSKLSGFRLLDALLFTGFDGEKLALNDLCLQLHERFSIKIKKQALDQRFNWNAVNFFKELFSELLAIQFPANIGHEHYPFHSIRVKDSTCFQLPDSLKEAFPGSGGGGSKASARIQFEMELTSGRVEDLSLHPFNEQDIMNAKKTVEDIQSGVLTIRDLAYYDLELIESINEKGAYYISRLPSNTKAYEYRNEQYVGIDFSKLEDYMNKHQIQTIAKDIYLGSTKVPTRLVISNLPEEEKNKRLRKARYESWKKGRNLSKEYKAKAGLNLFMTNLTYEAVSAEEVIKFYRLRWQIELVFKAWKSIGEIHKVKDIKLERFLCLIYAKLIWVLLNWEMLSPLNRYFQHHHGFTISYYKGYKYLTNQLSSLRAALMNGKESVERFLRNLGNLAIDYLQREKRKNKQGLQGYFEELRLV